MNFFVLIAAFLGLAAAVLCSEDTKSRSAYGDGAPAGYGVHGGYSHGAGSYGNAAAIPTVRCPNNYLFSCQPSLQPAPCSQGAPSYGGVGAYSENYPVYALQVPQYVNGYQTY